MRWVSVYVVPAAETASEIGLRRLSYEVSVLVSGLRTGEVTLVTDPTSTQSICFRRTEQCIIPYATQEGEISFCAYNTGVGWRQVIEKMKQTATVAEWNRTRGRHPVYAKGQDLPLPHGPG